MRYCLLSHVMECAEARLEKQGNLPKRKLGRMICYCRLQAVTRLLILGSWVRVPPGSPRKSRKIRTLSGVSIMGAKVRARRGSIRSPSKRRARSSVFFASKCGTVRAITKSTRGFALYAPASPDSAERRSWVANRVIDRRIRYPRATRRAEPSASRIRSGQPESRRLPGMSRASRLDLHRAVAPKGNPNYR
jgi:hypothetical protein